MESLLNDQHLVTDTERIEAKIVKNLPSNLEVNVRLKIARELNALAQILVELYRKK